MSIAVHAKRPLPGPAPSPTARPLSSPGFKARASPCHSLCLGPTSLDRTIFFPLSQSRRVVDQTTGSTAIQHRAQWADNTNIFPPLGLSITLIRAEDIPVPWRSELGVFQASRFIKCFYSITLQLQGVVSGGRRAAAVTCSLTQGHLHTLLDETR